MDPVEAIVARALEEDAAFQDVTTLAVVPASAQAQGQIVARQAGVLSGCAYAGAAFRQCDSDVQLLWRRGDGAAIAAGEVILRCSGRARGLLAAERTALNFLQQLSGVATHAASCAAAAGDVDVLDTRKTVPGLRDAQKAAVRHGGGRNQRRDLADELLLKENHFALSGLDYAGTVRRARLGARGKIVGVEARSEEAAAAALAAGADYVLLDNFPPAALAGVAGRLKARFPHAVLEASGGFGAHNLAQLRGSGIDRVSVGALTHSSPALDLSFYLDPLPVETAS
ncbi:MAG: carboxylating nicotinate-nucleotide diphosphorylase [Planctomycetota bacterium]|nr:MAG: carboxylating nicotinate-nucleotide diphosphorylase [Planctomycetota bacterium]